jgi:hypothetical protein
MKQHGVWLTALGCVLERLSNAEPLFRNKGGMLMLD